jgi:hypothetical protein
MHVPQMIETAMDVGVTQISINTTRRLSIDAVQQARSGHPVTPRFSASEPLKEWARGEE